VPGALQDETLRARVLAPGASAPGTLTAPRAFNLMFKTHVGALEDNQSVTYLRPETAQGIFVNFKNVTDTARVRVPFGIGQIGKAFRNEINPRNFTFRSREFEQMEIEFFCRASEAGQWYQYWRERRFQWYLDLGMKPSNLHLREHEASELAHYAAGCADVEYDFPFGRSELEGIANRTDFDLRQHSQMSGKDLRYFDDQEPNEEARRFLPHVIEPSAGADRGTLAFLCDAYNEDEVGGEARSHGGLDQARRLVLVRRGQGQRRRGGIHLINERPGRGRHAHGADGARRHIKEIASRARVTDRSCHWTHP